MQAEEAIIIIETAMVITGLTIVAAITLLVKTNKDVLGKKINAYIEDIKRLFK